MPSLAIYHFLKNECFSRKKIIGESISSYNMAILQLLLLGMTVSCQVKKTVGSLSPHTLDPI